MQGLGIEPCGVHEVGNRPAQASDHVMQFNTSSARLRHDRFVDKGKATERWRRKVTGLKG
jgi:hypothetical protein